MSSHSLVYASLGRAKIRDNRSRTADQVRLLEGDLTFLSAFVRISSSKNPSVQENFDSPRRKEKHAAFHSFLWGGGE
jgi:hypothetical protein